MIHQQYVMPTPFRGRRLSGSVSLSAVWQCQPLLLILELLFLWEPATLKIKSRIRNAFIQARRS